MAGIGRWLRPVGGVVLLGAVGVCFGSTLDDLLIYRLCSSEAIDRALQNPQLESALGKPLKIGPWYSATLAVAPGGKSASVTFPVRGSHGSASLRLRSLRWQGEGSTLVYNTIGAGKWELMALEAVVARQGGDDQSQRPLQRINLMPGGEGPKPGDMGRGECGPCKTAGLQEV